MPGVGVKGSWQADLSGRGRPVFNRRGLRPGLPPVHAGGEERHVAVEYLHSPGGLHLLPFGRFWKKSGTAFDGRPVLLRPSGGAGALPADLIRRPGERLLRGASPCGSPGV